MQAREHITEFVQLELVRRGRCGGRKRLDLPDDVRVARVVRHRFHLTGETAVEFGRPLGQDLSVAIDRVVLQIRVEQVECQDPRYHDDEWDHQFQQRGKDDTFLTLGQRLRPQRALRDVLIQSPIEEIRNPQPDHQRSPRDRRIGQRPHHVCLAIRQRPSVEVPEPLQGSGVLEAVDGHLLIARRLDEFFRSGVGQNRQGEKEHDRPACDERRALQQIGPGTRLEAAGKHVDRRQRADDPAADRDVPQIIAGHGHALEIARDDLGSRINDRGGRHADQDDQRGNRHDQAGKRVVAVLEKLRNRVDAAAEERGQEDKGHHDERDGGHPLVTGDRHAQPVGCLATHSHELLGRDIGGDQRESHQPPGQAAARQEVILGPVFAVRLLPRALPQPNGDNGHHEDDEDDEISNCHRFTLSLRHLARSTTNRRRSIAKAPAARTSALRVRRPARSTTVPVVPKPAGRWLAGPAPQPMYPNGGG